MRFLTILITLFIALAPVSAQPALISQADSSYMHENYTAACELYQQAIAKGGPSSNLYYNLGNSYYRSGKPAQAILYYEKALKMDPTNAEARQNLEFVNSKIVDKPGDRGSVLSKVLDDVVDSLHPNGWAWLAVGLFLLVILSVVAYVFAGSVLLRKAGFFGGGVLLLCSILSAVLAVIGAHKAMAHDTAIITAASVQLSTSPRVPKNKQEEAMFLHEGTKVTILDSVTTPSDSINPLWYDVQVDNSHRAWISAKDVEKI